MSDPDAFPGKKRGIIFTLNNYTAEELNFLDNVLGPRVAAGTDPISYLAYQQETSASGTPHLQGWAYRKHPLTRDGWKREFQTKRISVRVKGGSDESCEIYTGKEDEVGGRDPGTQRRSFGKMPSQGSRTDILDICRKALDPTVPLRDVANSDPDTFIKYWKGIERLRLLNTPSRRSKTVIYWFYGDTGSGKTRLAAELGGETMYWKMGDNTWWDGYDPISNPSVIIDDFRASNFKFDYMLTLLDRYPLLVNIKGTTSQFTGKQLFITSPRHPRDSYRSISGENLDQICRRIENISFFCRLDDKFVIRTISADPQHKFPDLPEWLHRYDDLSDADRDRIDRQEEERVAREEERRAALQEASAFAPTFKRFRS